MGISGLLPFLKKIHKPVNIAEFEGCTVAIDAYCWLHKGAFSCADKLAVGEKTDQYVYYCMKYIEYMLKNNIKPILVFDGCHLPSKKEVEKQRREKREIFRKKAAQFLREGKRNEAKECLQRCIDITSEMALELMKVCRERGVDCIVAPYEADAQLAFLNKAGIAQIIVTEDSDLLLFGCEKIIFKMDFFGNGFLVEQSRLNEVLDIKNGFYTFEKFRYMCILSGCDYLASLPGIGLAKAAKVFKTARQPDLRQLLKKLSTYIKINVTVPDEYVDNFIKADNTFLYQLTFDPLKRKLVPLNPYPPDINRQDLNYAGPMLSNEKAYQIALGNMDIYSGEKIHDFDPDNFVPSKASYLKKNQHLHMLSIWNKSYRPRPKVTLHEIQTPERPNLKGKEVIVEAKIFKRSPVKRPREVDDSKMVKTDGEFLDMYSDQLPDAKKLKTEDLSDLESQQEVSEESEITPKSTSPEKLAIDDSPSYKYSGRDKENTLLSPKKNRFALSTTSSKKSRFDINVGRTVEVKSRFFATNKKSTLLDSLKKEDMKTEQKTKQETEDEQLTSDTETEDADSDEREHNGIRNESAVNVEDDTCKFEENSSKISNSSSPIKQSHTKLHQHSLAKNSPSAFSWSTFKFLKQNSTLDESNKNTPFKSFKSSSLRHIKSESEINTGPSDNSYSTVDTDKVACSQSSYFSRPEKISTISKDCDDTVNSQEKILDQSDGEGIIDLTDDTSSIERVAPSSQKLMSSQKSSSIINSQKKKCRVSGLSKKQSGSPADNKQRSITDLFSKFAHTKSSSKIQPSKTEVDEDDDFHTPTSSQSIINRDSLVQRRLIE